MNIQKSLAVLLAVVLLLHPFGQVLLAQTKPSKPALITATWCGNCQVLKSPGDPIGKRIQALNKAGKVDIYENSGSDRKTWTLNGEKIDASEVPQTDFFPAFQQANTPPISPLNSAAITKALDAIEAGQKEASGDQCIPLRPGQTREGQQPTGDAQFKGFTTGYGGVADSTKVPRVGASAGFRDAPPFVSLVDPLPNDESVINYDLRKAGSRTLQEQVDETLKFKPATAPGKVAPKRTVIIPDSTQARQFLDSGGAAGGAGKYKIGDVEVQAGKHYTVGKTDTDGVTFDENCNPTQGPIPSTNPLGDFGDGEDVGFDGGGGGGGGGGPDGGGGGGLGGLASLLPALMQLMQGKQGQQGQQAQNPIYDGSQVQAQCSKQGVSPVCGTDRKSYTNSCYAEQLGVPVASTGACPAAPAAPDVNAITTQLSQSGVPASLISTIRDAIVSALTSALGGGTNVPETTIR